MVFEFELLAKKEYKSIQYSLPNIARLGRIKHSSGEWPMKRDDPSCILTPNTMIYTRFGHIPHLTRDLFDAYVAPYIGNGQNLIYQVSLSSMLQSLYTIEAAGGIKNFCRIPNNSILHLTLSDPLIRQKDIVTNNYIYLWTKKGDRHKVDMRLFENALKSLKVDTYITPYDFHTPDGCSEKKYKKSLIRSKNFLDNLSEQQSLVTDAIFSIGCASSIEFQLEFARGLYSKFPQMRAICLDVTHWFENMNYNENKDTNFLTPLIAKTLECIPSDKMRLIEGPFNPDEVLFLTKMGIDLFDSSYPVMLSENGKAFKLIDGYPSEVSNNKQYEMIDLGNESSATEHTALFSNCPCYVCQMGDGYSRAYINHLWTTKEMLANTLLIIHNICEWDRMFVAIRNNLNDQIIDE